CSRSDGGHGPPSPPRRRHSARTDDSLRAWASDTVDCPFRAMEAGMSLLLTDTYVVTMDDTGAEHPDGWVLIAEGRIAGVGGGAPPDADERVDLAGAVVTPGLVNTHHHLYQTLTRARAQQANLLEWLRELYPLWAGLD